MPEPVHVHAPRELSETPEHASRRERLLELAAAILMALATVAIAWSGYQAARWSGLQAQRDAEANAARAEANDARTLAAEQRLEDLTNFNRWLELSTEGNVVLASLYEARFRREFRPAFDAWLAEDPLLDPTATPSPLREDEYQLAANDEAERREDAAAESFDEGREATENGDHYVFTTVFLAAVLFFAGISLRFNWMPMRIAILVLAAVFFGAGLVQLFSLPVR
ncbi:MAG: hypothetical protein ACRDWD_11585 [Acidimicrobiia bacterium]